jgi:hypothetical protein
MHGKATRLRDHLYLIQNGRPSFHIPTRIPVAADAALTTRYIIRRLSGTSA